MIKRLLILLSTTLLFGCTPVEAWQKEDLARSHMSLDPNPGNHRFNQHMFDSREGASGGYGVSAGGCGCK